MVGKCHVKLNTINDFNYYTTREIFFIDNRFNNEKSD